MKTRPTGREGAFRICPSVLREGLGSPPPVFHQLEGPYGLTCASRPPTWARASPENKGPVILVTRHAEDWPQMWGCLCLARNAFMAK